MQTIFKKILKIFSNIFYAFKKKNDETDSDCSITFSELNHYFYSYQLYAAFIMMIKKQSSSNEEYLENEMKINKTIIIIMIWVLNAWLIENHWSVEHEKSYSKNSHLYFFKNASETVFCFSQHLWFFLCSCVNFSFSVKNLESWKDVTFVVSSKSLFLMWVQQWLKTIFNEQDKKNFMKFQLFINDIKHWVLEKIEHSSIELIAD